jgi:hypothetical protein
MFDWDGRRGVAERGGGGLADLQQNSVIAGLLSDD